MRVDVVLGTRPEIIKLAPVLDGLAQRGLAHRLVHTGQHYSYEMDRVFFEQLGVREPDVRLEVGSGSPGEQTGKMLARLEETFLAGRPDLVLVQGDTNTVLAGALAAAKLHIPIGHVEAGLRCGDWRLAEEQNRVVADHVSTLHFAPTKVSKANLAREGIRKEVTITGNTIVDAVRRWLPKGRNRSPLRGEAEGYILSTLHRQENVDDARRLRSLLSSLDRVGRDLGLEVIYPVHPRTRNRIVTHRIPAGRNLRLVDPMGYLEFLGSLAFARLVLTDSGGVQEEACILRVPCVTVRETTERPETVQVGANVVAGVTSKEILRAARKMARRKRHWRNPFGSGRSGQRIARICEQWLHSNAS